MFLYVLCVYIDAYAYKHVCVFDHACVNVCICVHVHLYVCIFVSM